MCAAYSLVSAMCAAVAGLGVGVVAVMFAWCHHYRDR